jgi:uncharacterized protein (TIGR02391 family)
MELKSLIKSSLWEAVSTNYSTNNYTGSILDAIMYTNNLIREKTDLQNDGVALIGDALGGNSPKLKINRMQTESEKNVQKGIEQLLRGVNQAIRNPRSHDKHNDSIQDANSLILFINYLLEFIDSAKSSFVLKDFLERVFDDDFVEDIQYAKLLVDEIPPNKLYDTVLNVYRNMQRGLPAKIKFFCTAALEKLKSEEIELLFEVISQDLKTMNLDDSIDIVVNAFSDFWLNFDKLSRIRVENKLIRSIGTGYYIKSDNNLVDGALGTWITEIADKLVMKDSFEQVITQKLYSSIYEEVDYLFNYFRNYIYTDQISPSRHAALIQGLKNGDIRFYNVILGYFNYDLSHPDIPQNILIAMASFTEKDLAPWVYSSDDLPF